MRELIVHRLKWDYQRAKRSPSWRRSINKHIAEAEDTLADNPSLKPKLEEILGEAYQRGVLQAARETELDRSVFPVICPYTVEELFASGGREG